MKFNFKGIKIYIGFSFAAASTLMLFFDHTNVALFSLISAILHELGHLFAMLLLNEKPEELRLLLFGMRIKKYAQSESYKKEIFIASAGPFVNIFIAVILIPFFNFTKSKSLMTFSSVNLLLGAFNALPIAETDGAYVLKNILTRHFTEEKADNIVFITSLIIIVPIFFCGFYVLIKSKYNFSLLIVSIYLALLVVLKKRKSNV